MRVKLLLVCVALASAAAAKPQVSIEESCRTARAIVVAESTDRAGVVRLHHVLYDGGGYKLKADSDATVDLKGMVYDKGKKYVLFMEPGDTPQTFRAVPQMRTEDSQPVREQVLKVLRDAGKVK